MPIFIPTPLTLTFNQAYDTTGLDQEDFRVFWKDRELEVRDMQMIPDSNMIRLKVDGTEINPCCRIPWSGCIHF